MKISHSSKETYLTCPKKWELHYKKGLKSTKIGSALMFGSAFDEAQNRMLLEKKKDLTEQEIDTMKKSPQDIFLENFTKVKVADKVLKIPKSEAALYYKSDLDLSLLDEKDQGSIYQFAKELDIDIENMQDIKYFIEECILVFKKGSLELDLQRLYNYICWLSLKNKGLLMLEAYRKEIMPQIEEVFEVQKYISLKDGSSELRGVVDLICSFVSEPGVKYVCDNKTSSRPYKEDSVSISEQLATYAEHEQNNKCAYIVTEKLIRKKEPKVRCSIIKDVISDSFVDKTFDNITEVFHNINEGKFEPDFNACFQYGQKCPYYDFCRDGKLDGLVYIKREKE
jgi:hypothetical protein